MFEIPNAKHILASNNPVKYSAPLARVMFTQVTIAVIMVDDPTIKCMYFMVKKFVPPSPYAL